MNQFEDMQTFVRIVEAGSITKAAEQMDTVKSALSKRLADLEKRLGVTLLTRTTRTQTLTHSGQSYYQQSIRLLADLAEIESVISNENCALQGGIKIAAPHSFGLTHLAPALCQFNKIHPDIIFEIDFNDRKVDLIEEGFDLAIRIAKLTDSTLIARKLTWGRGLLTASPAYLKKYGMPKTPEDLNQGHVKLHYSLGVDNWRFVNTSKDKNNKKTDKDEINIKIPTVLSANNGDFLCEQAVAGKGLLFTPDFICYKAVQNGSLVPILSDFIIQDKINAYAIYPQTRHLSQRVRTLVDFLVDYFGEEPYWKI